MSLFGSAPISVRLELAPVGERVTLDALGAGDHVLVGEDVAARRRSSRPSPGSARCAAARLEEVLEEAVEDGSPPRKGPKGFWYGSHLLGRDAHHGGPDALDRLHGRRAAQEGVARPGVRRREQPERQDCAGGAERSRPVHDLQTPGGERKFTAAAAAGVKVRRSPERAAKRTRPGATSLAAMSREELGSPAWMRRICIELFRAAVRRAAARRGARSGSGEPDRGAHRLQRRPGASLRDRPEHVGRGVAAQRRPLRVIAREIARAGRVRCGPARAGRQLARLRARRRCRGAAEAGRPRAGPTWPWPATCPLGRASPARRRSAWLWRRRSTPLAGWGLEPRSGRALAHRAESEFVGVPCGVMDQLASALGRDGARCASTAAAVEARRSRCGRGAALLIAHSGVGRRLVAGRLWRPPRRMRDGLPQHATPGVAPAGARPARRGAGPAASPRGSAAARAVPARAPRGRRERARRCQLRGRPARGRSRGAPARCSARARRACATTSRSAARSWTRSASSATRARRVRLAPHRGRVRRLHAPPGGPGARPPGSPRARRRLRRALRARPTVLSHPPVGRGEPPDLLGVGF